jgi:predicted anti-sigma-YlaC factor YlaD
MDCEPFRCAISAWLDGEDPGLDDTVLAQHVAECRSCRLFQAHALRLDRAVRHEALPAAPDLAPGILAAIGGQRRADSNLAPARATLVTIAVVQVALAVPALLFGVDGGAPIHIAREVGSFDVALAAGFVFCAWRPARAYGILPLVASLVACLALVSTVDVLQGRASLGGESVHLLEGFGLLMVWQLARSSAPRTKRPARGSRPTWARPAMQ